MNTDEINREMSFLECFVGTYSVNLLPENPLRKRPLGLIVNLDPHYEPGSHWVALFIDENNNASYFDSFGFPMFKKSILEFLIKNNVNQIEYNKYILQSVKSSVCGAFTILFLKMRCNGFSLAEFLKLYSNNFDNNDLIALRILNENNL